VMLMYSKGYVALFGEPHTMETIQTCVKSWLERFEKVEQVCSSGGASAMAFTVEKVEDVTDERDLQFRILMGNVFAWVYATLGSRVIETTGMPDDQDISLCLEVLLELPDVEEIIDQHNDRRLDELEAEGLM